MSASESIYDAFNALYTADTGTGGLNSTSPDGAARMMRFVREFDPQHHPSRRMNEDYIAFESNLSRRDPASTINAWFGVVRLHCYFTRDRASDKIDAVEARFREVFDRGMLANAGWSFGKPSMLGTMRIVGQDGEVVHGVVEFLVHFEQVGE